MTCPKCGHERQETDLADEGQCPKCGIFYEKFLALQAKTPREVKLV